MALNGGFDGQGSINFRLSHIEVEDSNKIKDNWTIQIQQSKKSNCMEEIFQIHKKEIKELNAMARDYLVLHKL